MSEFTLYLGTAIMLAVSILVTNMSFAEPSTVEAAYETDLAYQVQPSTLTSRKK